MRFVVRSPARATRRLAPALACALALVAIAACSSDKKSSTPEPSTTVSSVEGAPSSTASSTTTSSTRPPPTTTAPPSTGPTGTTISANDVFDNFTITPPSPVACNSPTMIELKWTSVGVSTVALLLDDKPFATYGGGAQDHLEYFACDGATHTYTLQARKGTTTETAIREVKSKAP